MTIEIDEKDLLEKINKAILDAVVFHVPAAKNYKTRVKVCACGHMTTMERHDGRTAHIAVMAQDAVGRVFDKEAEMRDRDL